MIIVFAGIFLIYLLGNSQWVFGGDSGDIILASYFAGVAHPPGYPLNTMIGWVFTHLPFTATVAYKANLMSVVLMAGTAAVFFDAVRRLTGNRLVAITAALILATTPLFWLYSHIAEVFPLLLFLVVTSIDLVMVRRVKLAVFVLGLSVFHHQTAVLLLPAFLYLIFRVDPSLMKTWKRRMVLAGIFCLGFLPYLFVPIAASLSPPINWDQASTPANFLRLLTRADYGTFSASRDLVGATALQRLSQLVSYWYFVKTDFGILGMLLIAAGSVLTFVKYRTIFWFLALAIFFSGPFFVFYASFALSAEFLFSVWERFLLLGYLFLGILAGFGLAVVFDVWIPVWRRFLIGRLSRRMAGVFLGLFLTVIPMSMAVSNFEKTDLSRHDAGDKLGHDALVSTEPGSLVFLFDDTLGFNTQYVYYTSREFADRRIMLGGLLRHQYYRKQVVQRYQDLVIPEGFFEEKKLSSQDFMVELARANVGKRSIYSYAFTPRIDDYKWMPVGLMHKLVVSEDESFARDLVDLNESVFLKFSARPGDFDNLYRHLVTDHIRGIYQAAMLGVADTLLKKDRSDALSFYGRAQGYMPGDNIYIGRGRAYLVLGDCAAARDQLTRVEEQKIEAYKILVQVARECDKDEEAAKKYEELLEQERQKQEPRF